MQLIMFVVFIYIYKTIYTGTFHRMLLNSLAINKNTIHTMFTLNLYRAFIKCGSMIGLTVHNLLAEL